MFSLRQEDLLYSLRPASQTRVLPPMDDRRAWAGLDADAAIALTQRAERALRAPLPHLTAGDYLHRPDAEPPAGYTLRREQAEDLILAACATGDEKYLPRLADLIWMMAEESGWSVFPRRGAPLPAFTVPDMDEHAARTAELFALARQTVGARFDHMTPQLTARIDFELRRRAFDPLIHRESDDWLHLSGGAPSICAHLMAACLAAETDEGERRWQALRRLLKILEGVLRAQLPDGGAAQDLARHVAAASALNDCFALLSLVSGGQVELRDEPRFIDMAILPCKLFIGDGWFVNPGSDPKPGLSPDTLFHLGEGVRSGSLCGLAAWLRRRSDGQIPEDAGLFSKYAILRGRADFLKESARVTLPGSALLPDMGVALARAGDFFAALTGGGTRTASSNRGVGDITLFYKNAPILIDCGLPDADAHSVPAIEGVEQAGARRAPEPPELQNGVFRMLTMGIAHAYPAAAKLQSWQRSLMLSPGENLVRLIDAFDFEGVKKRATLRFITPYEPVLRDGHALLGPVRMRFPDGLTPKVSPIPLTDARRAALLCEKLYRLELTMAESAAGARLDCMFSPT